MLHSLSGTVDEEAVSDDESRMPFAAEAVPPPSPTVATASRKRRQHKDPSGSSSNRGSSKIAGGVSKKKEAGGGGKGGKGGNGGRGGRGRNNRGKERNAKAEEEPAAAKQNRSRTLTAVERLAQERAALARSQQERKHGAAVKIQARLRGNIARDEVLYLLAELELGSDFEDEELENEEESAAALMIQKHVRGMKGRDK